MTEEAWAHLAVPLLEEVFDERADLDDARTDDERARTHALEGLAKREGLVHRLGFWDADQLVGAYLGAQREKACYRMCLTAVRPAWRRRGIYRAFLPALLDAVREAGFVEVESRHRADNNAVLVAKLERGFVITGFELSLRDGLMITLKHRFGEEARRAHRLRVGGRG
jgi:GNAT superfamily N-acetyltransferase